MKNSKSITNVNLILFISLLTLVSECSALKYSIDLPRNIFDRSNQGELWHPHLKKIQSNIYKDNFEIVDIRKSFIANVSLIQKQKNELVVENKVHSFLQVTEPLGNKDPKSPKMKCGCKFLRDNEKFIRDNLNALENKLAFSREHGAFVEVKDDNHLVEDNKSNIKSQEVSSNGGLNEKKLTPKNEKHLVETNQHYEISVSNQPIQPIKSSSEQKNENVYQQQINELRSEITHNNSLLNKIEFLLEKNSKQSDQPAPLNTIQNPVSQVINPGNIVPINNEVFMVNRNFNANQIQLPNNVLNANGNFFNNPYMLMNNNLNTVNGLQPNLNANALQMNTNPIGVILNNNNNLAAAYQNPYIVNANNFNPGLNNQFLGLNRF